jgi:Zn-dependent protease with chaperone function
VRFNFLICFVTFIFAFIDSVAAATTESVHKESILVQTRNFEKDLDRAGVFLKDSIVDTYLNFILQTLIPDEYTARSLQVRVLKSPSLNAFATPHGSIYICTGLLARIENEAQVAALLAHEMTHVINEHAFKNMINTKKRALSSARLQIGLEFLFGSFSGVIGNITMKSAITGYSRDLEREADSMGLIKMKEAGYAPIAFRNLFILLKTSIEQENIKQPFFFATHPALTERIENYYSLDGDDTLRASQGSENAGLFTKSITNVLLLDAAMKVAAGNFTVAELSLSRILESDSCNSQAYLLLGNITRLRASSEVNEHVFNWYYKAKNCDSTGSEPLRELGFYHFKNGKTDSASIYFNSFRERNPLSPYCPIIEDYLKKCER